jgi:hypothetical protein
MSFSQDICRTLVGGYGAYFYALKSSIGAKKLCLDCDALPLRVCD